MLVRMVTHPRVTEMFILLFQNFESSQMLPSFHPGKQLPFLFKDTSRAHHFHLLPRSNEAHAFVLA